MCRAVLGPDEVDQEGWHSAQQPVSCRRGVYRCIAHREGRICYTDVARNNVITPRTQRISNCLRMSHLLYIMGGF